LRGADSFPGNRLAGRACRPLRSPPGLAAHLLFDARFHEPHTPSPGRLPEADFDPMEAKPALTFPCACGGTFHVLGVDLRPHGRELTGRCDGPEHGAYVRRVRREIEKSLRLAGPQPGRNAARLEGAPPS
jgi:hypothetical protein